MKPNHRKAPRTCRDAGTLRQLQEAMTLVTRSRRCSGDRLRRVGKDMTTAFVLSGGASLGAIEVGMLLGLAEAECLQPGPATEGSRRARTTRATPRRRRTCCGCRRR